jgi:cytochrome c553
MRKQLAIVMCPRRRAAAIGAMAVALAVASPTLASSGDRALGEYLASECTGCHQISGRSDGRIPSIVGWPEDQFIAVVESYRDKHRDNPIMQTIAGRLTADEVAALASYFGSLKPAK